MLEFTVNLHAKTTSRVLKQDNTMVLCDLMPRNEHSAIVDKSQRVEMVGGSQVHLMAHYLSGQSCQGGFD